MDGRSGLIRPRIVHKPPGVYAHPTTPPRAVKRLDWTTAMLTPVIVAIPGQRHRITPVISLSGFRYLTVERWESATWQIVELISIPPYFTDGDIEQATNLAIERYLDRLS